MSVRVCLCVLCGRLLGGGGGGGWPLGSRLWCLLWVCRFPIGILGQVWYLIVSIPDLCTFTYFDRKNVHMYYVREKEGKNENLKKEGKMRISILISIYTVQFAILKMYTKFENTGSNKSREICDRNFHWRERKTNK